MFDALTFALNYVATKNFRVYAGDVIFVLLSCGRIIRKFDPAENYPLYGISSFYVGVNSDVDNRHMPIIGRLHCTCRVSFRWQGVIYTHLDPICYLLEIIVVKNNYSF